MMSVPPAVLTNLSRAGEHMRRSLAIILLPSVLVFCFPSTPLVSRSVAQNKASRIAKAEPASLTSQRGLYTISAAQLKDYLSFLASDELAGRDTPSRGLDTAAKFLATNLSRWGLKPAGDDGSYL